MSAPYTHVSASRIMGSWPIVGTIGMAGPSILPRTVLGSARIIGARQQPSAGFAVGGMSFYLWVDGVQKTVTFLAGNKTLAQVITAINAATAPDTVAYADNGFLRLESPTSGGSSSLRLETNTTSDVFAELGLFSEIESRGGDLVTTATYDVTRQIAYPGQLSWAEGEDMESRVFNRALFQLAMNADRSEGVIAKKRMAVQEQADFTYVPPGGGNPDGVTIPGTVYTGNLATESDLQRFFLVVDSDGKELVKEMQNTLVSTSVLNWTTDPETGDSIVSHGSAIFQSTDPTSDVYIVPSNLTGGAAVLNTHPIKIIRFIDTKTVVVSPIDPATGNVITVNQNPVSGKRVLIYTVPCRVSGVYDGPGAGANLLTGNTVQRHAPTSVTRIELGNRVYCPAANFSAVLPGDVVIYDNSLVDVPFSNNGTYRVSEVIDSRTLELVAEDWGPAVLNPNLPLGDPSTVEVTTDGKFWVNPFVRFNAAKAIPDSGEAFSIVHYTQSTLRDATDDPAIFLGTGLKMSQELDYLTQKAILCIIGPSATTIDAYVLNDRRINLEDLDARLDKEHHGGGTTEQGYGRHSTIRPDVIDMFPEITGYTTTWRAATAEDETDLKVQLVDSFGAPKMQMSATGSIGVRYGLTAGSLFPMAAFFAGVGESFGVETRDPFMDTFTAEQSTGGGSVAPGSYDYCVAAIDTNGSVGVASTPVTVVVVAPDDLVYLQWGGVEGNSRTRIYRKLTSGSTWYYKDTTATGPKVQWYMDWGTGWTTVGTPSTVNRALSSSYAGVYSYSWNSGYFNVGGGPMVGHLGVQGEQTSLLVLTRAGGGVAPPLDNSGREGWESPRIRFNLGYDNGSNSYMDILAQTWTGSWVDRLTVSFTNLGLKSTTVAGVSSALAIFGDASSSTSGTGVKGQGKGALPGVHGIGGATGVGVRGEGGASGYGGIFYGGATTGHGLWAEALADNKFGVYGKGYGSGAGVHGDGGLSSGPGVTGQGGVTNGNGVEGLGVGTGVGVKGQGGAPNGMGVEGLGAGTGSGVYGHNTSGGYGVQAATTGAGDASAAVYAEAGGSNAPAVKALATNGGIAVLAVTDGSSGRALQIIGPANATIVGRHAALNIAPQIGDPDPTNAAAGDVYVNNTTHGIRHRTSSEWAAIPSMRYGNSALGAEVSGTTSETTTLSYSIPANKLVVGSRIRIHAAISCTGDTGGGNISCYVRIGSILGPLAAAVIMVQNAGNSCYMDADVIITATGAGGNFITSSFGTANQLTGNQTIMGTVTNAIDTTVANTIVLSGMMSSGDAGNKFRGIDLSIDIL